MKTWVCNGINNGFYKQGNVKKTWILIRKASNYATVNPWKWPIQNKFWATNVVHTSFCKQEFGKEEQILLMDFEAKHE